MNRGGAPEETRPPSTNQVLNEGAADRGGIQVPARAAAATEDISGKVGGHNPTCKGDRRNVANVGSGGVVRESVRRPSPLENPLGRTTCSDNPFRLHNGAFCGFGPCGSLPAGVGETSRKEGHRQTACDTHSETSLSHKDWCLKSPSSGHPGPYRGSAGSPPRMASRSSGRSGQHDFGSSCGARGVVTFPLPNCRPQGPRPGDTKRRSVSSPAGSGIIAVGFPWPRLAEESRRAASSGLGRTARSGIAASLPDGVGSFVAPRGCATPCEGGRVNESNPPFSRPQVSINNAGLRGHVAAATGSQEGNVGPIPSLPAVVSEKRREEETSLVNGFPGVRPLWSTKRFEVGPLLSGFGAAIPDVDLAPVLFQPGLSAAAPFLNTTFLSGMPLSKIVTVRSFGSSSCAGGVAITSRPGPEQKGVTFRAPATRSSQILAPITHTKLNLQQILLWEAKNGGNAPEALALILDISAFESRLFQKPDSDFRRSDIREDNRLRLETWKTIDSLETGEIVTFLKVFQVPKSDIVTDRLVIDGTPINRVSLKPLPMNLPKLHFVLEGAGRFKFGFTIDAISWFYQFEIHPEIRKYFGLMFNRRRGRPYFRRFCRMAMGWLNAPCIGQRTSLALLRETASRLQQNHQIDAYFSTVWLDNFIFAADDVITLETILKVFLEVCFEANVQLHPPTPITTSIVILGFVVDLKTRSISHTDKWKSKVDDLFTSLTTSTPSLRDLARIVGCFVWTSFARRHPLAFFPAMMDMLRRIAFALENGKTWSWSDASELITSEFIAECKSALQLMHESFTIAIPGSAQFTMFSDARVDSEVANWAYVGEHLSVQGDFSQRHHIFFHELQAASQALIDVSRAHPALHVTLGVDNTAVMFALRSGHSGNRIADDWIRKLYLGLPSTFTFRVMHIDTLINPSDPFTRGKRAEVRCFSGEQPWRRAKEILQSIPLHLPIYG